MTEPGDSSAPRCIAETRFKPTRYSDNHTVRCQKDDGHDGMHAWKRDAREVSWCGEARKVEDNTRFRFGLGLS